MISVAEATARVLALSPALPVEHVALKQAAGRVMAGDAVATRAQPPFASSAMDGYALRSADAVAGARLDVVGESAAGRGFSGSIGPGQAVRIFTGAPIPNGADRVVIQEDVTRDGDRVLLGALPEGGTNIRPHGADFMPGARLTGPRRLGPADIALLASMNAAEVAVRRRPEVAVIGTGDELVMPGTEPGPDQIVASNIFGLAAMIEAEGGIARLLPVARDTVDSLRQMFALAEGADLIVTVGGASVGDHDLVAGVAQGLGAEMAFHKVALRPGKPLMSGRIGGVAMLGLPGNPVSALVCGALFLVPMLRAMQGLPDPLPKPLTARLGAAVDGNGPRAHYMRARLDGGIVTVFERQDSALLSVLADANALVVRPPGDPAKAAGDMVDCLPL
jgi:molybdopterin molybdotransferase